MQRAKSNCDFKKVSPLIILKPEVIKRLFSFQYDENKNLKRCCKWNNKNTKLFLKA